MRHPVKLKNWRSDKISRMNLPLSQDGQVLRKCPLVEDKRIKSKKNVKHPAIVRWLTKAQVSGGLLLAFPISFCRKHLPAKNTIMVLETESGERYETKYLFSGKLSRGWKSFAIDMKLKQGDGVLFHLVEPTKFKVYIIRANANEVNLPDHIVRLLTQVKQSVSSEEDIKHLIVYRRREKHQIAENKKKIKNTRLNSRNSEVSVLLHEGIQFRNITSFEEFKAVIHELIQNHDLPYYVLHDYYELCCNQNAFLHDHLFRGINLRLNNQTIVGAIRRIIFDTVNLANALSTCKLSTFFHKYSSWDKALKTYEALGMNFSLLHARLHYLKNLAESLEGAADRLRYEEACHECERAKSEVRKLEVMLAKLQTLKYKPLEGKNREGDSWFERAKAEIGNLEGLIAELGKFFAEYDAHIETLKLKVKTNELKFQEEVRAPWLDCPNF